MNRYTERIPLILAERFYKAGMPKVLLNRTPTYAECLDWLMDKGVMIDITVCRGKEYTAVIRWWTLVKEDIKRLSIYGYGKSESMVEALNEAFETIPEALEKVGIYNEE